MLDRIDRLPPEFGKPKKLPTCVLLGRFSRPTGTECPFCARPPARCRKLEQRYVPAHPSPWIAQDRSTTFWSTCESTLMFSNHGGNSCLLAYEDRFSPNCSLER